MDWEKKTAQRVALRDAAADPFNDMLTPGQSLLVSLQNAERVRKDNYANTVDAKMKSAREKLPALQPKHAVRSDMSIFHGAAPPEVHSLLPDARPAKANMEGVKSMLQIKMDKHQEVWDKLVGIRDSAKQVLEQSVAEKAAELKARIDSGDREVEEEMSVLADDKVMKLTEADVHNVWDAVAQRIPERAAWIEELSQELEAAEEERRQVVESALVDMVRGMNEVAHLSEGEVERILERESLGLNMAILSNRRAYADLVKRLQVAEVELEKRRREAWEDGLRRWRRLRTLHAMNLFKERIRSVEFTEPSERISLFSRLRDGQRAAHEALVRHVEVVPGLLPPHMSSKKVAAWQNEAVRLHMTWLAEVASWMSRLHEHENGVDAQAHELLDALLAEVLEYKGYPEDECRALVDQECGSVVRERRAAAEQLLEGTSKFLEWQAGEWHSFAVSMSDWLSGLAKLFEEHKSKMASNESEVRSTLKGRRDQFNADDAAREAALQAAVDDVSHASSEKALDEKVMIALQRLDDIENGYRDFHKTMTANVRQFPCTVQEVNDTYHYFMCHTIQVAPHAPKPAEVIAAEEAAAAAAAAAAEAARLAAEAAAAEAAAAAKKGAKKAPASATAKKKTEAAAAVAEPAAAAPAPTAPEPEAELNLEEVDKQAEDEDRELPMPDGTVFYAMKNICQVLLRRGAAIRRKELRAAAAAAAAAAAEAAAAAVAAAAAAAAAAAEAEAAAAAADKKAGKKPAKPASAAAAANTKSPALAAAEAAAEAAQAAAAAPPPEPVAPLVPLSLNGKPHCQEMQLPEDRLRGALEQLQVGMLKEMIEFSSRTIITAHTWAEDREGALTEELDAHLRQHRPRAGRIEEETRLSRSVELVAQRRRVEKHMRAQSKAVRDQAEQFGEWVAALEAEMARSIERLHGYDSFLAQCMSCKGLDIRKREAEALRARIERDLAAKLAELSERIASSCMRVTDANKAFDAAELKSFEEGGQYAAENVGTYRRSLQAVDSHMEGARASQLQRLEELRADITQQADEALEYVHSLLPSHHEDMGLLEKLGELLEAARKKARTELGRNSEEGIAISQELDKLDSLLGAAAASNQEGAGSGGLNGAAPLQLCKEVLRSLDVLRGMLYKQAKVLTFLQSTGLKIEPVDLTLDAEGEEPPAQSPPVTPAGGAKSAAAKKAPAAPAGKGASAKGAAGKGGAAAAEPGEVVPLAGDIEVVIDACKRDTEALARAYYDVIFPAEVKGGKGGKGGAKDAKKPASATKKPASPKGRRSPSPGPGDEEGPEPVRPIRYPHRIPRRLEVLLQQTDDVLQGLREQLAEHVASGMKELRTQVIRAYRLVERTPAAAMSLLVRHELHAARRAHSDTIKTFYSQQQELLSRVEAIRGSMHPRMINPSNRHELKALEAGEAERSAAFTAMMEAFAAAAVKGVEARGPLVRKRLVHLVGVLAQLLDNFLMPDDLPPLGEGEEYVYSLPGRKDDKQLHRLALANAEAEGIQPEAAPPGKDAKAAKAPAASAAKKAPGGKAGEGNTGGASPRPFSPLTWSLPLGNLDLQSLGWVNEEGSGLPVVLAEGQAAAAAAAAAAPGPGGKGGRPASDAKPPVGAKVAAAAAVADVQPTVSGLDTPCHRACIRAYRACLLQVEEVMRSSLGQGRALMATWVKDEALWRRTWQGLLAHVEGL